MKPKTPQKRVLAQRKFAQGVSMFTLEKRNISPSTSLQIQSGADKVEKQALFSLSANQYLDWVAFQKIHPHESDIECDDQIEGKETNDSLIDCVEEKKDYDMDKKIKEMTQKAPVIMLKKLDISLLAEKASDIPERIVTLKRPILKRRKSAAVIVRSSDSMSSSSEDSIFTRRRCSRKMELSCDNSSEDDTPLNKLCVDSRKNKQKVTKAEEAKNGIVAEQEVEEEKEIDFSKVTISTQKSIICRKSNRKSLSKIDGTTNDDDGTSVNAVELNEHVQKKEESHNEHKESVNAKEVTEMPQDILENSANLFGMSVLKKNPVMVPGSSDKMEILSDFTVTPPLLLQLSDDEDDLTFKVPELMPTKYKRKNSIDAHTCPVSCLSNHNTGEHEPNLIPLNLWQKKCKNCHILTRIRNTVTTMAEKETNNAEDVYQFKCENNKLTNYRHSTPQYHTMYLDCFEDNSPYIIQIVSCKQDNKPTLSARILRRSQLDPQLLKKASGDITSPTFIKEIVSSLEGPITTNPSASTEVDNEQNKRKQPKRYDVFPRPSQEAVMVEAPVYRPTGAEFENPIVYIESIRPEAEKFGICKIIPPADFKPTFNTVPEDLNFMSSNQYICKMYMRWASASRELCAIKTYLATQNVVFKRPPLIDGIEVNLAKLYHKVQRMGGLREVIEKKKWTRVAEEMNYSKTSNVETKLDRFYCKYLLPYDTLTSMERQDILRRVEVEWNKRFNKMLFRARNPLYRQQRILMETSSDDDDEDDDFPSLDESEDCVLPGRQMNVRTFKNIAQRSMEIHFPANPNPTPTQVENAYWEHVLFGREHICVNTASIDTGEKSFGFTKNKSDPYSRHPWNLKVLSNNPLSVLRSMGPVLSATVPALHLGMVFTTSCWHRDPHGLPWIEYLHEGPPKIWYGIPHDWSENFRKAVETLAPAYCQNKAIWLPSDIAMFPPKLLIDNKVSLSKTTQQAGEYIVVFPKAYSSSICTGYSISESVYFAPQSWLMTMQIDFQEVRDSCEPTMFSLEHLLISIANDPRSSQAVKIQIHNTLDIIIRDEIENRYALEKLGVPINVNMQPPKKKSFLHSWNVGEHTECDICRRTLFLSKVTGISGLDLCLEHAVRMLEVKSSEQIMQIKKCINVICFYTEDNLDEIMKSLRNSIM